MALYDGERRVEFLSVDEVKNVMMIYDEFDAYRRSFSNNPDVHAQTVLAYIKRIREEIPKEVRLALPDHFGLSSSPLKTLEQRCRGQISKAVAEH